MKTTLSKAVVSAALLLASPAFAYEHLYTVWFPPELE